MLATGGFDWAPDYMPKHFPGIELIGAPRTNTGDGQRMAAEAGALLERMDQANIAPATFTTYEGRRHAQPLYESYAPHCILVNRDGVRFVSEGSPALGSALDERDDRAASRSICRSGASSIRATRTLCRCTTRRRIRGSFAAPPTLEAIGGKDRPRSRDACARRSIASTAGRRKASTATSIAARLAWERYYTGDRALGTVEQAPFFAAPFLYVSLGTKGGARTNRYGEVLRPDRSVIGGLYCAGIAMANPIGTRAVGAGTTIGPCLTSGYIAGKSIARRND